MPKIEIGVPPELTSLLIAEAPPGDMEIPSVDGPHEGPYAENERPHPQEGLAMANETTHADESDTHMRRNLVIKNLQDEVHALNERVTALEERLEPIEADNQLLQAKALGL